MHTVLSGAWLTESRMIELVTKSLPKTVADPGVEGFRLRQKILFYWLYESTKPKDSLNDSYTHSYELTFHACTAFFRLPDSHRYKLVYKL